MLQLRLETEIRRASLAVAQSRHTPWQSATADHLVGSSRQMARRGLQHPSHGLCCPAPPDVLLEGQDLKLHGNLSDMHSARLPRLHTKLAKVEEIHNDQVAAEKTNIFQQMRVLKSHYDAVE